MKSIIDLVDEKRIEGIQDVVDHSSREGMRVVIDLKRDANPQVVLNQLFAFTQMQVTFGVIMLALVDGVPRVLSLKQMLEEYIRFQVEVITRRTLYDLRKAKERAHIVEALKVACDFIDEVIEIIRSSPDIPESKARLMARFGFGRRAGAGYRPDAPWPAGRSGTAEDRGRTRSAACTHRGDGSHSRG